MATYMLLLYAEDGASRPGPRGGPSCPNGTR